MTLWISDHRLRESAMPNSCSESIRDGARADAAFFDPPYNVRIACRVPRKPSRVRHRPLCLHGLAAHGERLG
jgi:hypothetical protein